MWDVRRVAETGSTNADVVALARDGAPEGTVVVADHQREGRGRLGRSWQTPAGTSLTASFLLRPVEVAPSRWPWLPLLLGVVVVAAVEQLTSVDAVLKWPNDVLVGNRKLAGLLVERLDTASGAAAVAGVGLNLSQDRAQLPDGATSLWLETGHERAPDRDAVLETLCEQLAAHYSAWREAGGDPAHGLADAYGRRCTTVGRQVRIELPGERLVAGTATHVDEWGRIVVRTSAAAEPVVVGAGDVVHLRPA